MQSIRIGNGQGFWGDSVDAPVELLRGGPIEYIGLDYLAEVTMSILLRQRMRAPDRGYAADFIDFIRRVLPELVDRGVRVVTNAGGLNPQACRDRVIDVATELGISGFKIAVIEGDDVLPRLPGLVEAGHELLNMDTGEPIAPLLGQVTSANAYLGAAPIVRALEREALIVISGRITDPALTLGPMVHEFGWSFDDWNRLAAGTIAGHILECGAQATGGNLTRWWEVPDLWNVGWPLVEAYADGSFIVTKQPDTGGMVTVETVAEQLLYEMGDPAGYITPDVVADFRSIELDQEGEDRVKVTGIRGRPRPDTLKLSATYHHSYKSTGHLTVSGPRAVEKARLAAEIVWRRLERAGLHFAEKDRLVEIVGANACLPGVLTPPDDPPEVVMRLGVRDESRSKVLRFGKELAPLVTAGPPGVTGYAGGRPRPQEVVALWPALLDRMEIEPAVEVTVEEV